MFPEIRKSKKPCCSTGGYFFYFMGYCFDIPPKEEKIE